MTYKIIDDTGYILDSGIKNKVCANEMIYHYRLCPGDMLEVTKS